MDDFVIVVQTASRFGDDRTRLYEVRLPRWFVEQTVITVLTLNLERRRTEKHMPEADEEYKINAALVSYGYACKTHLLASLCHDKQVKETAAFLIGQIMKSINPEGDQMSAEQKYEHIVRALKDQIQLLPVPARSCAEYARLFAVLGSVICAQGGFYHKLLKVRHPFGYVAMCALLMAGLLLREDVIHEHGAVDIAEKAPGFSAN